MVCKEPYRLKRARKPARVCHVVFEKSLLYLFYGSVCLGCLMVAYIMISLTTLVTGHRRAYDGLVGGEDQPIFRAAEVSLLLSFILGATAIVVLFVWGVMSPCGTRRAGQQRRPVAAVFDVRALDQPEQASGNASSGSFLSRSSVQSGSIPAGSMRSRMTGLLRLQTRVEPHTPGR
jgi:hypothetical protein